MPFSNIQSALDTHDFTECSIEGESLALGQFHERVHRQRARYAAFVGGDGSAAADLSRGDRRRIMQVLRKACMVMGPGQKSRLGRLGAGAALGAIIAGFATPVAAQYQAGGGSATGANSVAIGTGSTATHVNGVATGASNTATGDNAVAVGSSNNVNSFDSTGAIVLNGIFDRAAGGNYIFPAGVTGVNSYAIGIG
ncbi:MAG: hypothetical protein WAT18_11720, partial [Sphingorhabdus sp.]